MHNWHLIFFRIIDYIGTSPRLSGMLRALQCTSCLQIHPLIRALKCAALQQLLLDSGMLIQILVIGSLRGGCLFYYIQAAANSCFEILNWRSLDKSIFSVYFIITRTHAHTHALTLFLGTRNPGVFHTAVLANLPASKTIHYQYGDDKYGWSAWTSFSAPPSANTSVRIVAFGDLGQWQQDDTMQEVRVLSRGMGKRFRVDDDVMVDSLIPKFRVWTVIMSAFSSISWHLISPTTLRY